MAALHLLVAVTAGCSSGRGPAPAPATVHDTQSNSASVGGDSWTMPDLTGTPAVGATFTKATAIGFAVVRIDGESCQ